MLCRLGSCNANNYDHLYTVGQPHRQPLRTFVQSPRGLLFNPRGVLGRVYFPESFFPRRRAQPPGHRITGWGFFFLCDRVNSRKNGGEPSCLRHSRCSVLISRTSTLLSSFTPFSHEVTEPGHLRPG